MSRRQDLAEAVVVAEFAHELRPLDIPTGGGDHLPGQGGGLLDQVGQLDLDFSLPDRDAERSEPGHHAGVDAVAAGDLVAVMPGPTDVSVFFFPSFFFLTYHFMPFLGRQGLRTAAVGILTCFFFLDEQKSRFLSLFLS
jgi:hypothetical protein